MKLIKLSQQGFSHLIILAVIVSSVGVIGTYLIVKSHADSTCSSTQTVNGVTTTTNGTTNCSSTVCSTTINGVTSTTCPASSPISSYTGTGTSYTGTGSTGTTSTGTRTYVYPKFFSGTVTQDTCVDSAQPGCTITVHTSQGVDDVVTIVPATATSTWGKLYGFTATTNIVGKKAYVYGISTSQPNSFDLSKISAYVKVL